ncbi:hypothetical protein UlMin_042314 [Ulmus minor]
MDRKVPGPVASVRSRQSDLKRSFKLAVASLLTASSKQDFCNAFQKFSTADQDFLHRLFIQVVTSLHANVEEEFESLCLETQVGNALDTVDELVEEQALDPLLSNNTDVTNVARDVLTTKKNEIQHLKNMLEKAEERNHIIRAHLESLKKVSMVDLEKLRRGSLSYRLPGSGGINNP